MFLITSIPGGVLAVSTAYYFLHYRPSRISHDAQLAKEYCPKEVVAFLKCQEDRQLGRCDREVLFLHNCVYKSKGFNQMDMDFL